MSTTQPIKSLNQVKELINYYHFEKKNYRNYALICLGMNSALRISDLLQLKWKDVYNFKNNCFCKHISICEKKTKKQTQIAINDSAIHALKEYLENIPFPSEETYIFTGKYNQLPLSRSQAFRIIKEAGNQLHFENPISCHSLRKTFGYHAWKAGTPPAVLMAIYNHSSYRITKRYLGIDQDDKDYVFLKINL